MTISNSLRPSSSSHAVLILTAAFGEGHNAAARNLRDALLECSPKCPVEIHDIFQESYGWRHELVRKGYAALINHLPAVWNQIFEMMDKTSVVSNSARAGLLSAAAERLRALLIKIAPRVVISTFPGYGVLLDLLHKNGLKRDYQSIILLTDSISINSLWYRYYADVFITPNRQTSDVLEKAGIPSQRMVSLGFPVPLAFSKIATKKAPPLKGEKWKILYMVNAAPRKAPSIVKYLLTLKNAEITVTVGKNKALRKSLNRIAALRKQPLEVHGWTPQMFELIARSHVIIGKAGGATVQEALAGCTPLIITQIVPGQEEGNAQLILENGAGALASKGLQIVAKLREAFAEDGLLWKKWWNAARSLSHPDASLNIARFILAEQIRS